MTRADIVDEARRVQAAAEEEGLAVRLMGGVAILLQAPDGVPGALARAPKDIDVVARKGEGKPVRALLERLGYEPNARFNAMNSGRRALFYDTERERQLDVFVGGFEMCHVLPLADRLELEPVTLPLAELLLTKLQIYALNEKDQRDIFALLATHAVREDDDQAINAAYIAALCAADWGLWRTVKLNVDRSRESVGGYALGEPERRHVVEGLDALWERIVAEPKGTRWRLRDRVGDRKRWYEEPDEVG